MDAKYDTPEYRDFMRSNQQRTKIRAAEARVVEAAEKWRDGNGSELEMIGAVDALRKAREA